MQVTFDLLVAGFVVAAAILGAGRGLGGQLAALFSPLAGLGAGIPLSGRVAPWFGEHAPLNRFLALLVLYLGISLAVHVGALIYRRFLERRGLDGWDRQAGALLGAAKGFALSLALTVLAASFLEGVADEVRSTRAGRLMTHVVAAVRPALPTDVGEMLDPYLDPFDRASEGPLPPQHP